MNPFEMIVLIVAMVMIATVLMKRMDSKRSAADPADDENRRLRQQVATMQQRINTLERIVTDRGVDTAAQIEALRDRDRISEGDEA